MPRGSNRRPALSSYRIYHLLWSGLDLLFPPACGGCDSPGSRWCAKCQDGVSPLAGPLCSACGIPLGGSADLCAECRSVRPQFQILRSWSVFEGALRNALHRLKYRRDVGLGEALVPQLSLFVSSLGWSFDLVVPVPLSRERLRLRGYNQVGLIARPLAMALGVAYAHSAVARVRDTRSQVGLTRSERRENVRAAFRAAPAGFAGRSVLLVDDVATTGSTLSACAAALTTSGVRQVLALTVARALPIHGYGAA